jgi:Holliday junction resolvase RusA-like endonuclease
MTLNLTFPGVPKATQSARFAKIGKFMRSYQPKEQVEWKNYLKLEARQQLPESWTIIQDQPITLSATFVFPPLKSWPKQTLAQLDAGAVIPKTSRPDLTDNLMKGMIDALTGILWHDDALVAEVHSRKIYGHNPATHIELTTEETP